MIYEVATGVIITSSATPARPSDAQSWVSATWVGVPPQRDGTACTGTDWGARLDDDHTGVALDGSIGCPSGWSPSAETTTLQPSSISQPMCCRCPTWKRLPTWARSPFAPRTDQPARYGSSPRRPSRPCSATSRAACSITDGALFPWIPQGRPGHPPVGWAPTRSGRSTSSGRPSMGSLRRIGGHTLRVGLAASSPPTARPWPSYGRRAGGARRPRRRSTSGESPPPVRAVARRHMGQDNDEGRLRPQQPRLRPSPSRRPMLLLL